LKRSIPRLFLVLSLFVIATAQLVRAQDSSSDPAKADKSTSAGQTQAGPAASAPAQESLPALVRRVKPSVVSVLTYDAKGEPLISGTGFFIRPGEVVTNMHVIRGAHRVEIHTLDGKGRTYPVAGALSVDEEADLALLSVDLPAERSRPLTFASTLPDEGEQIFVIGNPCVWKDRLVKVLSLPCAKYRTLGASFKSPLPYRTATVAARCSTCGAR